MDLVTTKVVAMSVLGCVSLLIGFAPLKLSRIMGWSGTGRHSKRKDIITSILLCFGGGVLLSTSMIHMLPEVRKGINHINASSNHANHGDHETEVPYAEIILCCGFLLVYFIEELVLAVAKEEESTPIQRTFSMRASRKGLKRSIAINGANGQAPQEDADNDLVDKDNNEFHNNSPNGKSVKSSKKEAKITVEDSNENGVQCHPAKDEEDSVQVDSNRITEDENNGAIKPTTSGGSLFDQLNTDSPSAINPKYEGKMKRSGAESMFPNYHPNHEHQKMQKSLRRNRISIGATCTSLKGFLEQNCSCISCNKKDETDEGNNSNDKRIVSEIDQLCINHCGPGRLRDFVTVLSLSFHSIFEGLAVGLETSTESVWKLFAAIATHKFVITFCIGLELVSGNNQRSITTCAYIIYMVTFILVSPFGIAIGIAISELSGINIPHSATQTTLGMGHVITEAAEVSTQHHIVISILQGLAAGTILYIVVFEVLLREKSKRVPGLLQFLFIVLGFTIMLLVEIYVGHTHNGKQEVQNSFNPEDLHPEVHFHPTHLHNNHESNVDEGENHLILGFTNSTTNLDLVDNVIADNG